MNLATFLPYIPELISLGIGSVEKYSKASIDTLTEEELQKFIEIAKGNVKHWKDL